MPEAVLEAVKAGLGEGRGLLVALSGGLDSVVLLPCPALPAGGARPARGGGHLEHGIRGEESLGDMAFVQALCDAWQLPLSCRQISAPALAAQKGWNLEQAARNARYAFLEETRRQRGLDWILTAHHGDDQAETVLLHLARGSGLGGLCGMRARTGRVLRPLLGLDRAQLAEYAARNGLSYREDSSNQDLRYARNRLRARVLPELRAINPAAAANIRRCALALQEDEDYLQAQAAALFQKGARGKGLRLDMDAPRPLKLRALALYLRSLGDGDVERRKLVSLESLLAAPRGERASVGARLFESEGGRIHLVEDFGPFALSIPGPGRYALPDGSQLWVRLLPKPKELRGQANRRLFSARDVVLSPACPQPAKRGSGGALRTGGIQAAFGRAGGRQAAKVAARPPGRRGKGRLHSLRTPGGPLQAPSGVGERRKRHRDRVSSSGRIKECGSMHYSKDEIQSVLVSNEAIQARLDELAAQINRDYAGKELLLVCILKGAVAVFADILRRIEIPCSIDFMAISSYGSSTKSSGVVRILKDLDHGIEGKDVLVVEDIVDSGMSMKYLLENLETRSPASIRILSLLDKPSRRRVELQPDYVGFTIPDEFVIGYGLDYGEKYRNLPDVCILSPKVYA